MLQRATTLALILLIRNLVCREKVGGRGGRRSGRVETRNLYLFGLSFLLAILNRSLQIVKENLQIDCQAILAGNAVADLLRHIVHFIAEINQLGWAC